MTGVKVIVCGLDHSGSPVLQFQRLESTYIYSINMPVYPHIIYSNYAAHYATVYVCSLGSANWAEPGPGGLARGQAWPDDKKYRATL